MPNIPSADLAALGLDPQHLQHQLDRTKTSVFLGKSAAFLGSIMTMMDFHWSDAIPTAATDGDHFWWNPVWFLELPEKTRETVLVHELWHPGRLHMLRRGNRDPLIWNYACDIRINNDLQNDGYTFDGTSPWLDQSFTSAMSEEDIYDALIAQGMKPQGSTWGPCSPNAGGGNAPGQAANGQPQPGQIPDPLGDQNGQGDMIPGDGIDPNSSANDPRKQIGKVVRAIHQAKLSGDPGSIPGNIELIIEKFLEPIIPWETELQRFFTDLLDHDYTWARPNRRYPDIYLPSTFTDDGRLEHLIYYLDVSGSISNHDILRFNSEVKYVKETFNPQKMTLVQFDTQIQKEDVLEEDDDFKKVVVVGRGGTCLVPVREHIIKHKPTAAIIFTDLEVTPMRALPEEIPILWAVMGRRRQVPFGKVIAIPPEPKSSGKLR